MTWRAIASARDLLLASTLLPAPTNADDADPDAVLRAFEDTNAPIATVDVGTLYGGREELLDPRSVVR